MERCAFLFNSTIQTIKNRAFCRPPSCTEREPEQSGQMPMSPNGKAPALQAGFVGSIPTIGFAAPNSPINIPA